MSSLNRLLALEWASSVIQCFWCLFWENIWMRDCENVWALITRILCWSVTQTSWIIFMNLAPTVPEWSSCPINQVHSLLILIINVTRWQLQSMIRLHPHWKLDNEMKTIFSFDNTLGHWGLLNTNLSCAAVIIIRDDSVLTKLIYIWFTWEGSWQWLRFNSNINSRIEYKKYY